MRRKKNKIPFNQAIYKTTIQSLSHDGRGISTDEHGKTVFISGALAGEDVAYKLIKKQSRFDEAETSEIITASKHRTAPKCKHYGICGGCSMQHVDIDFQIEFKEKTLLNQLKHFGKAEPDAMLPMISGHDLGYRKKARLGVSYRHKQNKLFVGFRERASGFIAELESCPVLDPSVGLNIIKIRELILSLAAFEKIAQIEVAVGDDHTALVFRHLVDLTKPDLEKLQAFGATHQYHIYLQGNNPEPIQKLYPNDNHQRLNYYLHDYGLQMQFHPYDFTQVNTEINPLMIKSALALLDLQSDDVVLDLFCGLGNFTLPIAKFCKSVVGVEGSDEMVNRATENATLNTIHNTQFYAANLAKLPDSDTAWLQQKYTKVLIDPPRSGAKEIIEMIAKLTPKSIVYVSCNPATLARDAGELIHVHGYRLTKLGVINMFPHTSHIEAIALFEKV
jgi:23S rRNA (uracil1939-C5)-methyltransferase